MRRIFNKKPLKTDLDKRQEVLIVSINNGQKQIDDLMEKKNLDLQDVKKIESLKLARLNELQMLDNSVQDLQSKIEHMKNRKNELNDELNVISKEINDKYQSSLISESEKIEILTKLDKSIQERADQLEDLENNIIRSKKEHEQLINGFKFEIKRREERVSTLNDIIVGKEFVISNMSNKVDVIEETAQKLDNLQSEKLKELKLKEDLLQSMENELDQNEEMIAKMNLDLNLKQHEIDIAETDLQKKNERLLKILEREENVKKYSQEIKELYAKAGIYIDL